MQKYDKEKFIYDTSLLEFFSLANNVRPYHAGRRGADPYKAKSKFSKQTKQNI